MTRIKPRTRGKHLVRRSMQLDRQNDDTLQAYAAFIGEDADYVVNQLIDAILARDKDFMSWRADHPGLFAPRGTRRNCRPGAASASMPRTQAAQPSEMTTAATPMVS